MFGNLSSTDARGRAARGSPVFKRQLPMAFPSVSFGCRSTSGEARPTWRRLRMSRSGFQFVTQRCRGSCRAG
ncbi:unnamed protein product [Symbiodinium natans]|uniref:Uncharacterized protein n=1 Tax=Symbiodinium natans TaxID=878477 RepID=A0A812PK13_9DINO|nr:unnamed protein product [Symbiodinium natans]